MASHARAELIPADPNAGKYGTRRLDSLTGLRWFAAIVVFCRHVGDGTSWTHFATQGAAGVSFFFILSGFVLAYSYRSGDTAKKFYRRRFARIYPAFLVSVAAGCVVNHASVTAFRLVLVVFMVQDWSSAPADYFAINGVCWSLSCEAFFYLCFPLIIAAVIRLSGAQRRCALLGVATCALAVQLGIHSLDVNHGAPFWFMYVFPPTRLLEFVIGILIALEFRAGTRVRTGLLPVSILAVGTYIAAGFVPVYAMWVAIMLVPWMLLIWVAGSRDAGGHRSWLRWRPLVHLGEISYAFYLTHQLVIVAEGRIWRHLHLHLNQIEADAAALAIAIAIAELLWRFVECPLERRLRPRGGLSVSEGGIGHIAPE